MIRIFRPHTLLAFTCLVLFHLAQAQPLAKNYHPVVSKVIDGDTLILDAGQPVRLLGINTPELPGKNKPGEAGAYPAYRWLKKQVEHKRVSLEFDRQLKDKYGRLLAYVFSPEGKNINVTLVAEGYAIASIIPPNDKYTRQLLSAQQSAINNRLGIWGEPDYALVDIRQAIAGYRYGWKRMLATPASIIDDTKKDRHFVRLVIEEHIDIRIPRENLGYFPDISAYTGQVLEVRGWVSKRKGHYSVLIRHPSAIVRLNKSRIYGQKKAQVKPGLFHSGKAGLD